MLVTHEFIPRFICFCVALFAGHKCEFCESAEAIPKVRRPFPDHNWEGLHYRSLDEIPRDGSEVDDFQPRVVLRKLFAEGTIDDKKNVI